MNISKQPVRRFKPALPGITRCLLWSLLSLAALLALPHEACAVSFTLTPATTSNLYSGNLTLQISGLTNAEKVLVQRFIDLNSNGTIDAGEPMVQSFLLMDGQVASIGGVRNSNVPGDNDLAANGQIASTVSFLSGPEFTRAAATYIFRVSSPGGHFSPLQQTLVVTQSLSAPQITGTVSSGGSPLANAMVAVLVQIGNNNQFISGVVADGSGHFALAVTNGTYEVIGFMPGYVGNFGTSPLVTVSGANTNVTIPLSVASLTCAGAISDTATGTGVAGVQFFATSSASDYCAFFSDPLGNFSVPVTSGTWKLEASDFSLLMNGYLRGQGKVGVSVSANVSGVVVPVTKGTALIYGNLKDDQQHALPSVRLFAGDSNNQFQSSAYTDANGNFVLAVTNAVWYVGADGAGSGLPGGLVLQQAQVTVANGQAVLTNLVAQHATAYLVGKAVDSNSNPIGSGTMLAFYGSTGTGASATLASDGSFVMPVWGGQWSLALETQTAASHGVVSVQIPFSVTDGVSISNINYVAPISNRLISGWARNSTNAGVSGLNIFAGAVINGTNFNAGATTDNNGNYSLPVIPGVWNVGVDQQSLTQLGYGAVPNQNADTSAGNQTINFQLGGASVGMLFFRHRLGTVGEFGTNATPAVPYPVSIKNYQAIFRVSNDTNPPADSAVLFTGPPGSGLTNTPADPTLGPVQDGTNVYFFSPTVRNPAIASGGLWTVVYGTNLNYLQVPDPQASSRILVPVPTIQLSGNLLQRLTWSYHDQNGNLLVGTPSFVTSNRVDLLDQNGTPLDAEAFPASLSFNYPSTNMFPWFSVGFVRVDYYDNLTNQYYVGFSESDPSLTGYGTLNGNGYEFQLNGPPGQNYTVQFRTNLVLGTWNTLMVTNSLTSPIGIADHNATNASRFYRVKVGP